MKKYLLLTLSLLIVLSACNKKDDKVSPVSFSYKNLSTLIGRSESHVNDASPGNFVEYYKNTAYSYYEFLYDGLTEIGDINIDYHFIDSKCDYIFIYPSSEELAVAHKLIERAEAEFGVAEEYKLLYDDATYTFDTYAALVTIINENSLTVSDIEELNAYYLYKDYLISAGGYWYNDYFWPYVGIEVYNPDKKTTAFDHRIKAMK
jgi:hypothetical protein